MAIPFNTTIYGALPPNKTINRVISNDPKNVGMKYPLELSPKKGYFSKHTGIELIKSNLRQLLRTGRGERFMLPNYGCDLKKFLMEPLDETTFTSIQDEIVYSVTNYTNGININKLQIFESEENQLNVNLFCTISAENITNFNLNFQI
jgi:phage baseplate assembly protein W